MEWSFFGFLSVFLIGLGLNLTPCVYPMLSVTVALFSVERDSRFLSSLIRALVYVLGISIIYSTLGVFSALTGTFFGAALQHPILLAGFGVLMFVLALSMFGFFEIQIPSSILNRLGGKRRAGLVGLFLSGLLVGVFAAPCIGPPIVALMVYVGQRADPVSGFFVFFVLSLGLGFPYLLLGTFSGLLAKLPKSGEWLLWPKKIFGVLLICLGCYYLSLAFFPKAFQFIFPTILIVSGIWLGFVDQTGSRAPWFKGIKRAMGVLVILVAGVVVYFGFRPRVEWQPYEPAKLEMARQAKKPVVIDFYADWCTACHELDQFTYANPNVIRALQGAVKLKVDMTNLEDEGTQKIVEKYSLIGVPTVVFLNANGKEAEGARITGFASADEFIAAFNSAQSESKTR